MTRSLTSLTSLTFAINLPCVAIFLLTLCPALAYSCSGVEQRNYDNAVPKSVKLVNRRITKPLDSYKVDEARNFMKPKLKAKFDEMVAACQAVVARCVDGGIDYFGQGPPWCPTSIEKKARKLKGNYTRLARRAGSRGCSQRLMIYKSVDKYQEWVVKKVQPLADICRDGVLPPLEQVEPLDQPPHSLVRPANKRSCRTVEVSVPDCWDPSINF